MTSYDAGVVYAANREGSVRMDQKHLRTRVTRRCLVRLGWFTAGLVVLGGQLGLLLKLFFSPTTSERPKGQVVVGPIERFSVGRVTHFRKSGFLLNRLSTGFRALSQECTHPRCNVNNRPERNMIDCPCHGTQFSLTGAVLAGPAPRPLDRFAATIRDGQVHVNTSRPLPSGPSSG